MGKIVNGVLFWTQTDIADVLDVLPYKLRRLEDEGAIDAPTKQIGRRHYYTPEAAQKIIDEFPNLKTRDGRGIWLARRKAEGGKIEQN